MDASIPDRILQIDLTDLTYTWEDIPSLWIRQFVGGKGLGARYLYDALGAGTDPESVENQLLLMVGPLTGYLPDGGRFAAITKSPLTGLFLDSYAGGTFGPALRAAFPRAAGIAITGEADAPHVLDLRGGTIEIREAPTLARKRTDEVDDVYPDSAVLCVGPAGEAGVNFATIAADGGDHHAGRGGAGAVMGTKGLKAVILDKDTPTITDSRIQSLREETRALFAESPYGRAYRASGTHESIGFADALSMLPTRGWQDRSFEQADELGAEAVGDIATGRENPDKAFPGDYRVQVGEYETVMRGGTPIALGAGLGFADVDIVSALGATCDRLGIDVISAGNVVALAILASRSGAIDRDIDFGNEGSVHDLLNEVGHRSTPLGDTLADGVDEAADHLELQDVIPTVKSMAVPSYDPRGAPAVALGYATSDRGACHRRGVPATVDAFRSGWTETQLARAVAREQDRRAFHWCLIVDDVTDPMSGDLGRRWLDTMGLSLERTAFDRIGSRTWTMTRLFNVREGADRTSDALPVLFEEGPDGIDRSMFERTLDRYYEWREWDINGRPSERLLDRLNLLEICDDATPIGGPPLRPAAPQANG